MYIVTSKPKRISEYSGLVHIIISPFYFKGIAIRFFWITWRRYYAAI